MYYLKRFLLSALIPLWVLMDFCWVMGFEYLTMIFATLSILSSLFLSFYTTGVRRLENLILFFWIVGNFLWALGDFYEWEFDEVPAILFGLAAILSVNYIQIIIRKIDIFK